jgi:hypothetical protein
MKTTKVILMAALVSAAAMSANAGVRFGFSIGLPLPVVVIPRVVVSAPVVTVPAPVVETVPVCPSPDYVWAPGYWSYRPTGYAWVHGGWNHRPVFVERHHVDYGHRW